MKLRELIQPLESARVLGDAEATVGAVADDSRQVRPGDVFVAVAGGRHDGHGFAAAAVAAGAAAVVVERPLALAVPQVVVPSTSRALGVLAARAAGDPAERMTLLGVTGTNGKTTTTYLLESILRAAGGRPAVVGTVSYRFAGREEAAPFTTPFPVALHRVLARMVDAGCTHLVMETSSSALAQDRLTGMRFQVGLFSNFTQDHLDVHGTMEAYFAAKARLFAERLAPGGAAVANVDDPRGEEMLGFAPAGVRRLRVSTRGRPAEIGVVAAETSTRGVRATLATPRGRLELETPALLGAFNVDNLALAAGAAVALDLDLAVIAAGVAALPGVPGRVERVANRRGLDILVDYAHTPDALERVLAALRPLTRGRLVAVFGCGGDRDPTKRPRMGAIAARDADLAVVTSDNPRTEDPLAILAAVLDGVRAAGAAEIPPAGLGGAARGYSAIPDRRRAIAAAVAALKAGDVLLIAGKGHEDYQILGSTKIHFDDREEAAAAVAALGEPTP